MWQCTVAKTGIREVVEAPARDKLRQVMLDRELTGQLPGKMMLVSNFIHLGLFDIYLTLIRHIFFSLLFKKISINRTSILSSVVRRILGNCHKYFIGS